MWRKKELTKTVMNVIAKRFPVHGFQCDLFFSPLVSVKLDKCDEAQDAFCCLRHVKVNLLKLLKTLFWWYLEEKRKRKQFLKSESELVSPLINCSQQAILPPVSGKSSFFTFYFYLIIIFHLIIKTLATATGKLSFCVGQRAAQENGSFEVVTALTAPA